MTLSPQCRKQEEKRYFYLNMREVMVVTETKGVGLLCVCYAYISIPCVISVRDITDSAYNWFPNDLQFQLRPRWMVSC